MSIRAFIPPLQSFPQGDLNLCLKSHKTILVSLLLLLFMSVCITIHETTTRLYLCSNMFPFNKIQSFGIVVFWNQHKKEKLVYARQILKFPPLCMWKGNSHSDSGILSRFKIGKYYIWKSNIKFYGLKMLLDSLCVLNAFHPPRFKSLGSPD